MNVKELIKNKGLGYWLSCGAALLALVTAIIVFATSGTALPNTASGIIPAAKTIPTAIDQNRNAISRGSLMAVRKRTIDNAPTIPRESTTFDVTAKITRVEIIVSATRVTPNVDEYITPEKVFL